MRKLRNNTAEVVRRIKDGEILELTEHGQPVARIVPLTLDRWEHLRILGELEAPENAYPTELLAVPPVEAVPGVATPSTILAQLRANER